MYKQVLPPSELPPVTWLRQISVSYDTSSKPQLLKRAKIVVLLCACYYFARNRSKVVEHWKLVGREVNLKELIQIGSNLGSVFAYKRGKSTFFQLVRTHCVDGSLREVGLY